MWIALFAEL